MLFDDKTLAAVLESYTKSCVQYDDDMDEWIEKLHDFYDGNQLESASGESYFAKLEGETEERFKMRKPFFLTVNITEDIIGQLCQNYLLPPERKIWRGDDPTVPGATDSLTEIISTLWKQAQFSDDMANADRESVLVGGVFGLVQWDEERNGLDVRWYPYNHVWILTADDDPTRIVLLKTYYTRYDPLTGKNWVDVWVYTDDMISHYINGEWVEQPNNPEDANPYGVIPFVHLRHETTLNDVWGRGLGKEIVQANQQINQYLSDIRYRDLVQSYKQIVLKDCELKSNTIGMLAPLRVHSIPGSERQADVTTLDMNAPTGKSMENLVKYMSAVYAKYGLAARSVLNISNSSPQSGVAKNMDNLDVVKFNQLRQLSLIQAETDIAKLGLRIAAYHLGQVYDPDDYTIEINFTEYTPPMTSTEKTARQQWLESIGALTTIDIMVAELDITREEAIERYIQNKVQEAVLKQEVSKRIAQELGLGG